jgi:YidC/Oxa1 family membrane protein insertase
MDKRSLFFIVLVSLSFFFVNLYFTKNDMERQQALKKEETQKKERLAKEQAADIAQRTAALSQLGLVELYSDDAASNFIGFGWKSNGAVLAISKNPTLPKKLFARELGTTQQFSPLSYVTSEQEENFAPAVYTTGASDAKIATLSVPIFGQYDVQVAAYTGDADLPLEVVLGTLDDGVYTTLDHDRIPVGLAFLKGKNRYLPVGFIENDKLVPLSESSTFLPLLVLENSTKGNGTTNGNGSGKFYLLENPTMQLVFSEVGGAIVEINLPFEEEVDKVEEGKEELPQVHPKRSPKSEPTDEIYLKSVVKPTDPDRRMIEIDPKNALFPQHPTLLPNGTEAPQKLGGYYPLLRRDLVEPSGKIKTKVSPETYALSIVSQYPELANLNYKVISHTSDEIVFEGEQDMRKIRKTFRLSHAADALPYLFELEIKMEGDTKGLWLTTGVPEVEWIAGSPAPVLKYRITKSGSAQVEDATLPTDTVTLNSLQPDWIANSNGFFGIIVDPQTEIANGLRAVRLSGATAPSRLVALAKEFPKWTAQDLPGYLMMLPLKPTSGTSKYRVIAGPFSTPILKLLDANLKEDLTGESPDYILCQSFHGWFTFISEPFAKFLFWIMQGSFWITGSWFLSIIAVTIVLRILLWPLNAWSARSTAAMQKVSPIVASIQEKYKKDPKMMQLKMMEVYREHKINPLSGCLPLLIQMPFLIGMFDLLKSTYALRGASFIPGWIDDLSAPDVLFSWDYSIPLIGSEFHLLPFLLGGVMWLQARISSPAPSDPSKMTDQQRQQRSMMTFMSIIFTVMFYSFPSGLNIYWLSSMLLGILQQLWTSGRLRLKKTATKV